MEHIKEFNELMYRASCYMLSPLNYDMRTVDRYHSHWRRIRSLWAYIASERIVVR
jgi:hypothetical protein